MDLAVISSEYGKYCTVSTIAFFLFVDRVLVTISRQIFKHTEEEIDNYKFWAVSLLYSFIMSCLVIPCIWVYYEDIVEDISGFHNGYIYYTLCFALGFLIYDTVDLIAHIEYSNIAVFLHHAVVASLLLYHLINRQQMALCVVALTMQVNAMFLYLRKLLQTLGLREHWMYTIAVVLNMITFVIFRVGGFILLALAVKHLGNSVNFPQLCVLWTTWTVLLLFNTQMFSVLLKSDAYEICPCLRSENEKTE